MAVTKVQLEAEDHVRDADFKNALHGKTATENVGFSAMMKKDKEAQAAAADEYFKFWDGKEAGVETEQDKKVYSSPPPRYPKLSLLTLFPGPH